MAERTYYELLQISPAASDEEIKAAYRALAWRPAGNAGQDELKLVNEAYATLSSPQRRAAYDQALATGATTVSPDPVGSASLPPIRPVMPAAMVTGSEEERVPKGSLPFRLWGMISDMVWHISRVRYVFIPFTWIIGGMLLFAAAYLVGEYRLAVHPSPLRTTIKEVVQQVPEQKYISVVGSAVYDDGFTERGNNTTVEYHILFTPGDVILIKGTLGQSSGRFTGLLRRFDTEIAAQLQQKSRDSYWQGVNMLTTHYLDLGYLPGAPSRYLAGLAVVLLALLVLFLPGLRRYTVFVAGPLRWEEPVGGMLESPLRVEVVGTFRPDQGRRWGRFHAGIPASLTAAPDGGFMVSTWIGARATETGYGLLVPPGAQVRLGLDHAGGRTRPALKVRIPGQTIYLRLDSLTEARLLAQAIRG